MLRTEKAANLSTPSRSAAASAGRHMPSVLTFLLMAVVMLVADLASKSVAFKEVAHYPVVLTQSQDYDSVDNHKSGYQKIPFDRPDLIKQDKNGVEVFPKILNLRLTTNTGAVFGLGKGEQWFLSGVSIVAVAVMVQVFWRSRPGAYVLHACLGLIMAGAMGNLYDRITFGAVRDFFYLFPGVQLPFGWHWPKDDPRLYPWIFNLADVALVVGVALLLLLVGRGGRSVQTAPVSDRPRPAVEKARD